MKKSFFLFLASLSFVFGANAQMIDEYNFVVTDEIEHLPIENQYLSSTCWSYSALSLLESEIIRTKKEKIDLSEMYIVRCVYIEKAKKYVRMHGTISFTGGGALNDVTDIIKKYGILPNSEYTGLLNGANNHDHYTMDSVLLAYVDNLVEKEEIEADWLKGYVDILDEYLGKVPKKFKYKDQSYNPKSFADYLGLNMDDYILFTSFMHHPFYQPFVLEVPDNWSWGMAYNVSVNDMIDIIDNSLNYGYSVAWASDVSENGFSWKSGMAIAPAKESDDMFMSPVKQMDVNQVDRQEAFDTYLTTDDHGMHIVGSAIDVDGNKYYYVKNSWGTNTKTEGYLYASVAFVKYKTMSFMVHKDVIPDNLKLKLGMK